MFGVVREHINSHLSHRLWKRVLVTFFYFKEVGITFQRQETDGKNFFLETLFFEIGCALFSNNWVQILFWALMLKNYVWPWYILVQIHISYTFFFIFVHENFPSKWLQSFELYYSQMLFLVFPLILYPSIESLQKNE